LRAIAILAKCPFLFYFVIVVLLHLYLVFIVFFYQLIRTFGVVLGLRIFVFFPLDLSYSFLLSSIRGSVILTREVHVVMSYLFILDSSRNRADLYSSLI
jgi:hypothetical protein